jgi:long-chain fatty acid transport protein
VLRQSTAINNALDGLRDGQLRIKSNAWGVGGVVGILVEPTPRTRIGLQYTTPMSMRFDDVVEEVAGAGRSIQFLRLVIGAIVDVPVGSQVDLKLTMPQQVMVSAYHEFTDRFALMGNVGWQNWRAFGQPEVTIHGGGAATRELNLEQGYDDTWHVAIGAHYRLTPEWLLTGGFAYDSSAVSDCRRTVAFPVDQQFRYALGVQYVLSKSLTLGAAYTLIYGGTAPVNQTGGRSRARSWATTCRTSSTPSVSTSPGGSSVTGTSGPRGGRPSMSAPKIASPRRFPPRDGRYQKWIRCQNWPPGARTIRRKLEDTTSAR